MNQDTFNQGLLAFIANSPTPFHACQNMAAILEASQFKLLQEQESWQLEPGKAYYVIRNQSSIIAFRIGNKNPIDTGIHCIGAHTDSPCLKVKPNAKIHNKGYLQLGVEVYGGVLLRTWFDRDLSLAGRIHFENASGEIESCLLNFARPIACIPNLAIHLDREANENHSINPQTDIPPILLQTDDKELDFASLLTQQIQLEHPAIKLAKILDYELSFYDTQAPAIIGLQQDFIASARLDNLLSCYVGLTALCQGDAQTTSLLVCNDHEEVGSTSACGAQGTFLKSAIERICTNQEQYARTIDQSFFISADNAHGVHPNFATKHDDLHGPILNKGPVIKTNANQRYASNSETSAYFKQLCLKAKCPVQPFVVRTDMACGSTIGPITASEIGIKTIDVGVPTFAMHSIRELAGTADAFSLYNAFRIFYA